MPTDVSTEDGGGGRSAEGVSRIRFSHDGPGDQRADDVSSCSTLPVPSCSSAAHVAGGGCSAAAPLNTAKFPFHWDICLFTHHAKSAKVALECENAVALPLHLECLRRRDVGDGRGGRERRAVGSAGPWRGLVTQTHRFQRRARREHDVVHRQLRRRRLLLQQLVVESWQGRHLAVVSA